MKASKSRTGWIILMSALYTIHTCGQAIVRNWFKKPSRAWVDKTMHIWVKRILDLVGVTCTVYNPHHTQPQAGEATIIMCNHSSLYDIPLSLYAFPHVSIRMLAKKELSKVPFMGGGMRAAEFPFVDRKNRRQAIQDLATVKKLLESGIVMWIAPEGTRSKNGKLAPFKKGAFITAIEAKAKIIPIGIRGAHDILPAKTHYFNLYEQAEVHIGEAIDASEYTLENKEALINRVFQTMKELVGEVESK